MIVYLTNHQYVKLWTPHIEAREQLSPFLRYQLWNQEYKPKYNIDYREDLEVDNLAFYGSVIGHEKDITWFLLNL